MKRVIVLLALIALGSSKNEPADPIVGSGWNLVWAEEFDYTGLPNSDFWSFETGYVRNNEEQYYTNQRLENCIVKDGYLQITALKDSFRNHAITSASIETKDKVSFKYGRIEVRAKLPKLALGTWPAIWTKGDNYDTVGWPYCGEIDIMEWVGRIPTVILGSIYSKAQSSTVIKEGHKFYVADSSSFLTEYFHNYVIEWDSTSISYFLDDINYGTLTIDDFGSDWDPLTKSHYLKLNLAMGGEIPPFGGGGPIDYTKFPFTFIVDYVRYYEKTE
jgi:beta-glucanase (GH16 family)